MDSIPPQFKKTVYQPKIQRVSRFSRILNAITESSAIFIKYEIIFVRMILNRLKIKLIALVIEDNPTCYEVE